MNDDPIGSDQVQAMAGQTSPVGVLLNVDGTATLTAAHKLGHANSTIPNKNIKLKSADGNEILHVIIASIVLAAQLRELRSRKRIPLN